MAEALFDAEFLGHLEQLRLHFRARAGGQSGGGRRSRQQGISAEFSDFREYQPGDDFRRIDWNAYARFQRLVLKLFLEERQMQVFLLLDNSRSMEMYQKSYMAKRLALTMGYLALTSYDQVSVVPLGQDTQAFGPTSGKNSFVQMAQYLEELPRGQSSNLTQSITSLHLPSGPGICYLFTDAFSQDGLEDALAYLRYRKKETTLVHILSPNEIAPDYTEGTLRLLDCETGEERAVEITSSLLRSYEEALSSFRAHLQESCHRYGHRYEWIPSDMDLRQAVLEQLMERSL